MKTLILVILVSAFAALATSQPIKYSKKTDAGMLDAGIKQSSGSEGQ